MEKTTDEIPSLVILKSKDGKAVKIKGEKRLAVLEAVMMILGKRNAPKIGSIQFDITLPEQFDFVEAGALAISLGYKTKEEIADYLERHIQRCET